MADQEEEKIEALTMPCKLKIARAKQHINDLNTQMLTYFEQRPIVLMTRGNPEADQQTHFIKKKVAIPQQFSLIIGDAIHNLRTALDMLMFSMIGCRAERPQSVQFPFTGRADSLVGTMNSRETNIAGEKVVEEIKRLKPYADGNKWLYSVHALDIADKHKLIIPVVTSGDIPSIEFARMFPNMKGARDNISIRFFEETTFTQEFEGSSPSYSRF